MITWFAFLLFDLFLVYLAYEFPFMILWSGMGIFAVTSVLFYTAKEFFQKKE